VTSSGGVQGKVIGVLGGTGPQGKGLARRFAAAGLEVVIGSRDADRARGVAEELGFGVRGVSNGDCAEAGDVVVVAVPWDGHAELLTALRDDLRGTIVVDCVNPLGFDHEGPFRLDVPEGSAAQQAQSLLPQASVVAAFHHVSAAHLNDPELDSVDCDVLVLGDDRSATDVVRALVDVIPGMRGVFAGRLRNAASVEGLTANLIAINRRYRTSAGVRVTGL
jgi:8-hydroxy-5-deazaflavin:NADPH oxidoreductase